MTRTNLKRTKRIRIWLIVALAACVGVFTIFALSNADWTAYLALWPAAIIVVFLVRSFTAPADTRDAAAGVMTTYNNLYLARPDVEPDLLPPHTTHELFAPPDPLSDGKIILERNGGTETTGSTQNGDTEKGSAPNGSAEARATP